MSNRPGAPSTDRPTATYPATYPATHPATYPAPSYTSQALPEGWRVDPRPSRYLDADDPRLAQADATPTGTFPARRSVRPARHDGAGRPRPLDHPAGDAASLSHGGALGRAVYHTSRTSPSEQTDQQPIQDMGRPGILRRPSMRWHPSLMQLAIGAALVAALLGACNVAAIHAHREGRAYCRALTVSDWDRAQRECRGTDASTPAPEQAPAQAPMPDRASTAQSDARSGIQSEWVTSDTGAPYDRTDPAASPLDLPRCTTAPSTPLPCLATVSPDSRRAVVLEEDASLTGLNRQ